MTLQTASDMSDLSIPLFARSLKQTLSPGERPRSYRTSYFAEGTSGLIISPDSGKQERFVVAVSAMGPKDTMWPEISSGFGSQDRSSFVFYWQLRQFMSTNTIAIAVSPSESMML